MEQDKMRKTKRTRKQELPSTISRKSSSFSYFCSNKRLLKMAFCSIFVRSKLLLGTAKIGILSRFMYMLSFKNTIFFFILFILSAKNSAAQENYITRKTATGKAKELFEESKKQFSKGDLKAAIK